jgi:hypothetical protein
MSAQLANKSAGNSKIVACANPSRIDLSIMDLQICVGFMSRTISLMPVRTHHQILGVTRSLLTRELNEIKICAAMASSVGHPVDIHLPEQMLSCAITINLGVVVKVFAANSSR